MNPRCEQSGGWMERVSGKRRAPSNRSSKPARTNAPSKFPKSPLGMDDLYVDPEVEYRENLRQFPVTDQYVRSVQQEFEAASRLVLLGGNARYTMEDDEDTPFDRYLFRFCEIRTHRHSTENHPLDLEKCMRNLVANPNRSYDPRATLNADDRYTLLRLPNCRTWEGWLGSPFDARTGVEGPSDSSSVASQDTDVGRFLHNLEANVPIQLYGTHVDAQAFAPQHSLGVVYHIDGVSRFFVCMVFVNVRYLARSTAVDRSEQPSFSLQPPAGETDTSNGFTLKYRPPAGSITGKPVYYFYLVCDCNPKRT